MPYRKMTPSESFFFRNAGHSYDPSRETKRTGRIRYARELARAENEAKVRGWSVLWEDEIDVDLSWCECETDGVEHEHEVLCAILYGEDWTNTLKSRRDMKVLGSLGNIVDADRNYRRVVEAELALEALRELGAD